jgi:cytochrome c oxidase subunit IV
MTNTVIYTAIACLFLIGLSNLLVKVFEKIEGARISLIYISLFSKLVFLSGFTLVVKDQLENKIMYATTILFAIMYSTVNLVLKLVKNGKI